MTRLFSYDEASKEYGLPRDMLVQAVSDGTLKAIKRGNGFVRLREETIDAWLRGQEQVH